ncbi:DEAD/DEAH box helicase [Nitriliruptoraceae bacterium ZYF776]|nr:DEAD/DEAH box helicase [Profundirhabdus halotolerans]
MTDHLTDTPHTAEHDESPTAADATPTSGAVTPGSPDAPLEPTPEAAERPTRSFADVGVDPDLVEALAAKGIDAPFPIQELTLPLATAGHDVIGQARTGTGKTLAFGLALLGRLKPGGGTQALVVVPTRELCIQVADELQIGRARGLSVIAIYGGVGYEEQEQAFRDGVEVVVGTPGRLLDHVGRGNLRLDGVTELVLDEADEMLDMGFLPDVERLIEACNDDRHSMLFSATMPTEVVKLARRYLDRPTFMRASHEPQQTAPNVEQHFFQVHRMDKPRVLARILQAPERGGVYVFVRTKHMADRLVRELEDLGTPAIAIHGDLRQATREKNLDRFRDGSATVLVATEVAARGLDVENVTHVVNYDCPDDEKMYLHRIGRTARAGAKGVAVTFAEFNETDRLNVIRKALGLTEHAIEAMFSTSPELVEKFDLPAERPWDVHVEQAKAGTRTDRRSDEGDRKGARGGKGGRGGRDGGRGDGGRGERGRGGERPTGRTDGRPKSRRSAEGAGGEHDADRDRSRRRRDEETTDTSSASRPHDGGARGRGSRARDERGRDERSGGDRGRDERSRGDRSRDDRAAEDGGRDERRDELPRVRARSSGSREERSGDARRERDGEERARTRTRTRASGSAARTRDDDRPRDDRRGDDRRGDERSRARRDDDRDRSPSGDGASDERRTSRSRARRRDAGGDERRGDRGQRDDRSQRDDRGGRDRSRDGERDGSRGSERGERGGRGSERSGGRGSERSGGRGERRSDRRSNGGGRDGGNRDGGGRNGGSGRNGGGRNRNSRDDRGRGNGRDGSRGGRGRDDRDPTVVTAERGADARGEGEPQLARRVRVEHLP